MGARETRLVKQAGQMTLPPGGGWVVVKGNPYTGRGNRIIGSHRAEGIKHFDMYWAYDEACPWKYPYGGMYNDGGASPEEKVNFMLDANHICQVQTTWMSLHAPSSQLIRVWSGEVFATTEDTIQLMLMEDYIETISFRGPNPVWDEMTKDLIGSLMLDGLSKAQAQYELITAKAMKTKEVHKPNWFYRPIGDFREMFSEEPEYEAWYAPEKELATVDQGLVGKRFR